MTLVNIYLGNGTK